MQNKKNKLILFFFIIILTSTFTLQSQDKLKDVNYNKDPNLNYQLSEQILHKYNPSSITITHSVSQIILPGNSRSCSTPDSGLHTDNSYWRAFDLPSFGITNDFNITNVSIGIEHAISKSGTQPIKCYLYSSSSPFPLGYPSSLTLIGTSTVYVPDQAGTIFDIPIMGTATAGTNLVVQIFTPDGRPLGNSFYIGSNNLGQTDSSYINAMVCGISNPTDVSDLGWAGMHVVMNIIGYEGDLRSRVQFVHNSADILIDSVDVYIDDVLTLDNFMFRSATPFLDLNTGAVLNIGIAPSNSTSVNDTIVNFPITLNAGEKYIIFINGVLSSGYAINPDGRDLDLKLSIKSLARETALGSDFDLFVFQGATDAPTIDIKLREAGNILLVDDASYGDITSYISISPADYILDIFLSNGTTLVNSFDAPLLGLGGGVGTVFTSGFLNPATNQNGADFGLFTALSNGKVIEFKPKIIPVELSSFTANVNGSNVVLNWRTATETNNSGFNVERNNDKGFKSIGFIPGNGTTTEIQNYSFLDSKLPVGSYTYRLKQIDFNGAFQYSNKIKIDITIPNELTLYQNFPNPFNPSTTISFSMPNNNFVSLKVFNLLGQEIYTLLDEVKEAGIYSVKFDASSLPSGIYLYKLVTGDLFKNKKMLLIK